MTLRDKLKFWILLSSYVEMIVRGTSPISLSDAIANSLEYLKAFGGTEQRNIPAEYTQVEYIESTGTQYIDTGYKSSNNTKVKAQISCPNFNTFIFGSRNNVSGDSQKRFGLYFGTSWNPQYANQNLSPAGQTSVNTIYNVEMLQDGFYANGSFVTSFASATFSGDYNMYLFANNTADTTIGYGIARIYVFKIYDNGVLVRNFIPARRNSDNVLGMYDTVSGTFLTNAGTGTFTAGGEAVPTPDAPMDIVSNNGVLKVRHQSGLPLGYTLLDYIESTGTQYIDTGINPKTSLSVKIKYNMLQLTAEKNIAIFGSISSQVGLFSGAAGTPSKYYINSGAEALSDIPFALNTIREEEYINDTMIRNGVTYTTKPIVENNISMTLFGRNTGSEVSRIGTLRIYYFTLYDNGILVQNLIPCKRNSDNVVGMYDLVSGQFFTNQGTGDFVAGTAVSEPIEIYTDGTVETIVSQGKNLYNPATSVDGYLTDAGDITPSADGKTSALIEVKPSTTYTLKLLRTAEAIYTRVCSYDATETFLSLLVKNTTITAGYVTATFTTDATAKYVRISFKYDSTEVQLEEGSSATTYEPYYYGGTATCEMLLKVGDYQDVQSIIDGVVTRKVGVKVLDGTENWVASDTGTNVYVSDNALAQRVPGKVVSLCNTYNYNALSQSQINNGEYGLSGSTFVNIFFKNNSYTTVSQWRTYLAQQYAAGTPVIIVYPLATPTTESVAGQTMQVQAGDNFVEITQAAIDNLELEVKYKKGA